MRRTTYSDMYCTQCGCKNIPVRRRVGREREPGHLKKMWCLHCNKEVNMVEVREFGSGYTKEDFFWEFNHGNFTEEGTRKLKFSEFRDKMAKEQKDNEYTDNDDRTTWFGEEHLCEGDSTEN